MRFFLFLWFSIVTVELLANDVNTQGGAIKLSPKPKMRAVDRDWEYFKSVPCERISSEVYHSQPEEILLAKRKSQCMNKYDAFFAKPVKQ